MRFNEVIDMDCIIRPWKISDRERLAGLLNNPKVQDNLRDGLPFPYTPGKNTFAPCWRQTGQRPSLLPLQPRVMW